MRAATDIVALDRRARRAKKQGTRWVGLCPFHQEKSPSFSVNAEMGVFHCFGCQRVGRRHHLRTSRSSTSTSWRRYGAWPTGPASPSPRTPRATAERQRRAPLNDAWKRPSTSITSACSRPPTPARRATTCARVATTATSCASSVWGGRPTTGTRWPSASRCPRKVLNDAGLGFVNRRGRQQDAFRARVMFPIFDPAGRAVALGGRIVPPGPGGSTAASDPSGPSTRTPRRAPSTPSAARSTASTGPRRTW